MFSGILNVPLFADLWSVPHLTLTSVDAGRVVTLNVTLPPVAGMLFGAKVSEVIIGSVV
jgi:hypothetical protein